MTDSPPDTIDIGRILQVLPHRYPFLLVDRIVEFQEKTRAVGIKCVTVNEPFFPGHFPGHPVMPGVLLVEAMAQSAAVYFTGIDRAKFRRPVIPGDVLTMTLTVTHLRQRTCKMHGEARVEGQLAAEADILSALVDR